MTDDANTFEEGDQPRGRASREWEVFVRADIDGPLTHVGSVTAEERDGAREQAGALFEDPVAIWLCPDEAVFRYTDDAHTPGESA
ncbi:Htur_1727 family rSAM-partnered candidate RiPP [Halorhabdus salina]|uniref:Htur_1727 family rSAM-partnered candidate RiPP n=1 Tax=Halorhabdus salina TaxID=2750670 RepID=UPI0015EF9136|nr:Htur_1727 family rSAM-partnered candidate RiPP [Halorhabdus salina]